MTAIVHTADLSLVGWLVAVLCVLGAAYMGYLRRVVECVLLLVVAVIAVALLT